MYVLTSKGKKIAVPEGDIDEIVANKNSAMPAGLLNTLTLHEIADLFAYLENPPPTNVTRKKQRRPN